MIRIALLGFAIATVTASVASAQNRMIYGAGMVSCGKWQQYRSSGDKPNSYQAQAWIDGFLSGYNSATDGPDFLTPKPSSIAYYAWVDNYCKEKPLDELALAVFALKKELASRARRAQ
jgi:hypothetical protein